MTTKDIVFYHINSLEGKVDIQILTKEILTNDPNSKWDNSHWSFYKTQITTEKGRYFHLFSDEVKNNLKAITHGLIDLSDMNKRVLSINSNTYKPEKDKWPEWKIPDDSEQLSLAKVLLPYVKILSPAIVELIVDDNNKNLLMWTDELQNLGIRPDIYLWENSPVTFPGIRRHVGSQEISAFKTNSKKLTIKDALYIDANSFPKELWSFALRNSKYGNTNPANYSMAHILDHKDYKSRNVYELNGFQKSEDKNLFAGLFTSCTNTIYIPTTFLKPTDHNSSMRQLLVQIVDRYYGQICNVLPHNLTFNLTNIPDHWRLDNFPQPTIVGKTDNICNFIKYRNNIINSKIKELKLAKDL